MRKTGSTMLLILVCIGATFSFDAQVVKSKFTTTADSQCIQIPQNTETGLQGQWEVQDEGFRNRDLPRKLDLLRHKDLPRYVWCDNDSVELIVGVDVVSTQVQRLRELISKEGCTVVDTVSIGETVKAFTVKVPINGTYFFAERLKANRWVKYVEPNTKVKAFFAPNDPIWNLQWGPKKIEADWAWNTTIGSSDILVAILDTGIDYYHQDLAANYVPLGFDWVNWDLDSRDDHGHGSHCAGIVAAVLNNRVGIAGLAQVHIMAEKVLDSDGYGFWEWLADGITHATDQGAKIISMSLGGLFEPPAFVHDAVKYAYDRGVLLVAAAGNTGEDEKSWPAVYDEVIAVSATDQNDQLAGFSSFGNWIELAAPGVGIYSTVLYNGYASWSGTSMACPHVAGIAALAWSVFPSLSRDKLRRQLQRTADDLGEFGFDEYYGYGRVNARKAVTGVPEHDIGVVEWQHPSRLYPEQPGVFNATISNYGRSNETNVSVQFLVNDTLIDSATIDFLEEDTSKVVSFSWSATVLGSYNATCYAVPVLGESPTENNVASALVFVRFPTTLRVPDDYPTVKAAINSADSEDIILVNEGDYAEGQIIIDKDNIALVANGNVTLNGLRHLCVLNIRANHVTIKGFILQNCPYFDGTYYGIKMTGNGHIIINNTIRNNYSGGMLLSYSLNNNISLNTIANNHEGGMLLEHCSNNTIRINELTSNLWNGIGLYESTSNIICLNNIKKETTEILGAAIYLSSSSDYNIINSNNITNNSRGIIIDGSQNNLFRNNTMANNKWSFGFENIPDIPNYAFNDVDVSNTVDGKPIYHLINERGMVIPSNAGYVALINCSNIVVKNLDLKNNMQGIVLFNTNSSQIIQNNISATDNYGILLMSSSTNNTVSLNNVMSSRYNGITISGSSNHIVVSQNYVANHGLWGITLSGYLNTVCLNNITNNVGDVDVGGSYNNVSLNNMEAIEKACVYLSGSHNILSLNNITASRYLVICMYLYSSVNNTIVHNNFIIKNNAGKIYSYKSHDNVWDDSYPSGGNYYSWYADIDKFRGPNQNEPASDGIGDMSYVVDVNSNSVDHYPLMKPWKGPIDIGISQANVSKILLYQGLTASINGTIINYGLYTATFNLTIFANTTTIYTLTNIVRTARNSFTFIFVWDTTRYVPGKYAITVSVTPIQGETDTTDNTRSAGSITVRLPGDINGDGTVNIQDATQIGLYWQQRVPPAPANVDINNDGIVNIKDATIVGVNWQKHA